MDVAQVQMDKWKLIRGTAPQHCGSYFFNDTMVHEECTCVCAWQHCCSAPALSLELVMVYGVLRKHLSAATNTLKVRIWAPTIAWHTASHKMHLTGPMCLRTSDSSYTTFHGQHISYNERRCHSTAYQTTPPHEVEKGAHKCICNE